MSDSLGDQSGQHAEGIQHISSNATPPGTTDTSRGTEGGLGTGTQSGGVSALDDIRSPLKPGSGNGGELQQTDSQGGLVDTVKSYLGYGNNGASETGQLGTAGETRNVADTTSTTGSGTGYGTSTGSGTGYGNSTGTGSGAGIAGAAASAASAVGLGSGNSAAGGGLGSTSASSGAGYDTTGSSSTGGAGSTLETAKEKVQEVTNQDTKTVTSGTDDHKPPQPAGGKPHKLENESAIPTAGGERLGEKHWGESKIVPDNPEKRASEAGISSEEGQPTQQTTDNTAANVGGATGPPSSSAAGNSGSGSGSGNGEDKPSMGDKIKDKLHIGKKE